MRLRTSLYALDMKKSLSSTGLSSLWPSLPATLSWVPYSSLSEHITPSLNTCMRGKDKAYFKLQLLLYAMQKKDLNINT